MGYEVSTETILRRLMLVCIIITAGISGIAIMGWMLDRLILAGIRTDYIPMALSTALLFIILSGALLVYIRQPAFPHISMIARFCVFLVIFISLIILIEFFTGMTFDIERFLITSPEKIEGVPIGRMSPITAVNFILAGSALLLLLASPAAGRQRARGTAAFIATIVISVGFVVLLGYLYGTPLLYGGNIIPVALTTAIVFVFLGIGIILAAGQQYWPLSSFMGTSVSARLLRVFLPVTIALVLIMGFLDVVIFQNYGNHVIVSSVVTILALIIFSIIIPKVSNLIGGDIDRAITERKKAEEALRENEIIAHARADELAALMDAIPSITFIAHDPDCRRMTSSRAALRLLRLPAMANTSMSAPEGERPRTFRTMKDGREMQAEELPVQLAAATGQDVRNFEMTFVFNDGTSCDILGDAVPLFDSEGKVRGAVGAFLDITQHKRTEKELKKHRDHLDELVKERTIALSESEEKFKSIFDNASDGILLAEIGTKKFLMGNRMICEMLGFDEEELKNINVKDIHPEKDLSYVMEQFEKQARKEIDIAKDIPIKRKDGSIFYADIKSGIIKIGGKAYNLGTFRDITGRKRAEELAKLEDRRLQSLLKISLYKPETQYNLLNMALDEVVSLSDSKVGYIYYYNEEKEEFTLHAWSKNVMESCTIQDPQTTYQLRKTGIWGEAVRQRKPIIVNDFQAYNPLKKGYPVGHIPLLRFMTLPVFNNEGIVAVVGVGNKENDYNDIDLVQLKQMMDSVWLIAQRQQAEESMKLAKEEAENANMAKTNFLETMSHELRTPLNAINGFSQMLKQKTSGELNEKQEHFIDNIITGGNNLNNIIGQILDVVKMYEGTLELSIEKIPVPETLDEIIGVIKEKAAKKKVLIEENLDPELEYLEADKQKFKQVFINLLDNAVKFSKDEGGTININAEKEGEMAKFSVSDRGIGIKEEDKGKIFRKFSQLVSGTSRKYGGMGIGLAISKQFVELHGGKIYVESKYGIGTTFTFLIPLVANKREGK